MKTILGILIAFMYSSTAIGQVLHTDTSGILYLDNTIFYGTRNDANRYQKTLLDKPDDSQLMIIGDTVFMKREDQKISSWVKIYQNDKSGLREIGEIVDAEVNDSRIIVTFQNKYDSNHFMFDRKTF